MELKVIALLLFATLLALIALGIHYRQKTDRLRRQRIAEMEESAKRDMAARAAKKPPVKVWHGETDRYAAPRGSTRIPGGAAPATRTTEPSGFYDPLNPLNPISPISAFSSSVDDSPCRDPGPSYSDSSPSTCDSSPTTWD